MGGILLLGVFLVVPACCLFELQLDLGDMRLNIDSVS